MKRLSCKDMEKQTAPSSPGALCPESSVQAMPEKPGVPVTRQQIADYLASLRARGCVEGSVKKYSRDLTLFYDFLPDGKEITRSTLEEWRAELLAHGYAPRTVNAALSEANGFLEWLDLRKYQLVGQLDIGDDVQPELTRAEYLRLLSTARALGKERTYLLVKTFATTGIMVQELPRLTVEAVRDNRLIVTSNGLRQILHIPASLQDDLTRYIRRMGLVSGPVFVTRNGRRLNRTAVTAAIQGLAQDARVPPEKCNPRCLRKLYQSTMAGIEASVHLLVEQTHDRLLEQEQLTVGWEEVNEP